MKDAAAPDARPDPDELLKHVQEAEAEAARGRLTVFFGAAPGVGKTYAMLEAARSERDQKRDVIVGIVETHGRYDTAALLLGLEIFPRRKVEYKGVTLEELDVDGILARKPGVVLIDELAHTNAPGSRHAKRWQDVEEILASGIHVYTTLNVQHLESLNDVIAQITGVIVKETVPDTFFDLAYEVRVVDLPVDGFLERLREGRVYVPDAAARASQNFFREGNLTALRELALRRTAERVDAKMRGYKAVHGIEETWHTGDRVLVCVSSSPHSGRLVRAAHRMARGLHAELIALYVETPASIRMTAQARERLAHNMRLAESLAADTVTLRAEDAAVETVRYARKRNVTKIVLGKPTHARWRDVVKPSFLDDVVRNSREIDVYVISGLEDVDVATKLSETESKDAPKSRAGYVAAGVVMSIVTSLAAILFGRDQLADVVMIILLGVVIVSMRFGYGPSILAAVLGVVCFDFFFVPPYYSFAVSDLRHTVTFAVMFLVAVVISHLTRRIREQADSARGRERRTASLFAASRELGAALSREALLRIAAKHVSAVFAVKIAILTPDKDGHLARAFTDEESFDEQDKDWGVAEWVWTHQKPAGAETDTLPSSRALVVPLTGSRGVVGVLALFLSGGAKLRDPDERQLLETFSRLIGLALERTALAEEARGAKLRAETEQLRNALLSSVSHDLRTPLGVVTGATSTLLDANGPKDEKTRRELIETAHEESLRLSRLVHNLLQMTRLEAGALHVARDVQPLEEVVGAALNRTEDRLRGRAVTTDLPDDLPLVGIDSALIEQVLINVLENATKYTPAGSAIDVSAREKDGFIEIRVDDRGPGISAKNRDRVFEKFYRVEEREGGGAGLGLAICRGIVAAHGGKIWVEPRDGGGASFRFTLPIAASARENDPPPAELPT